MALIQSSSVFLDEAASEDEDEDEDEDQADESTQMTNPEPKSPTLQKTESELYNLIEKADEEVNELRSKLEEVTRENVVLKSK